MSKSILYTFKNYKCGVCNKYYFAKGTVPVPKIEYDQYGYKLKVEVCHNCAPDLYVGWTIDGKKYEQAPEPSKEPEVPEDERIYLDLDSYQQLKWFRQNPVCMLLYKMCSPRRKQ